MAQRESSRSSEIAWLVYFLFVFGASAYLLLRNLVPHHFNDKIAVMLAAIFSGLVLIGTRALAGAKWRRG